jgi:hypothetical protein
MARRFDQVDQNTRDIVASLTSTRRLPDPYLATRDRIITERLEKLDARLLTIFHILNQAEDGSRPGRFHGPWPEVNAIESSFDVVDKEALLKSIEKRVRRDAEEPILDSFRFITMNDRLDQVTEAHRETFEWIFKDQTSSTGPPPWGNFVDWLRSGDGIYWIHGKAGSGKSTLMSFIFSHPRTQRELSIWSTNCIKAGFFFWNSGSKDQRSHTGLLRSLIVAILDQYRSLIPLIFPSQWAHNYAEAVKETNQFIKKTWSYPEISAIFEEIMSQDAIRFNMCLFIDGLDEYDDNKDNIIDFVTKLSLSSRVKLYVSSRPLLEFSDVFSNFPSLKLQDLTFSDIQKYVSDNLASNKHYQVLASRESTKAPALVQELVHKADGVFLWVKLVTQSLISGLKNRDSISDLKRRLDDIPGDLEDLYSHMLSHIHPFYLGHASQLFQIANAAHQEAKVIGREDVDQIPLTVVALSFAVDEDPTLAITAGIYPIPTDEIRERCRLMEDRLKSQSAGLLEVQGSVGSPKPGNMEFSKAPEGNSKVQYLHRTVRDYLTRPDIWSKQLERTKGSSFNPHLALLRSYILLLKGIVASWVPEKLARVAYLALEHASFADFETGASNAELLDELDRTMTDHMGRSEGLHWTSRQFGDISPLGYDSFIAAAVNYGLCAYVRAKALSGVPLVFSSRQGLRRLLQDKAPRHRVRPLFDVAVNNDPRFRLAPGSSNMVSLFLQQGAMPSDKYLNATIWERALFGSDGLLANQDKLGGRGGATWLDNLRQRLEIVDLLIQHSADVMASIETNGARLTALNRIQSMDFSVFFPEETIELVSRLKYGSVKEQRLRARNKGGFRSFGIIAKERG